MKNILNWKNVECELPEYDRIVLATGYVFDGIALASLSFEKRYKEVEDFNNWTVQPFGTAHFCTKNGVKSWAYLQKEEPSQEFTYNKQVFQIQFKDKCRWVDIPHEQFDTLKKAEQSKEVLLFSSLFYDAELRIEEKNITQNYPFYFKEVTR